MKKNLVKIAVYAAVALASSAVTGLIMKWTELGRINKRIRPTKPGKAPTLKIENGTVAPIQTVAPVRQLG
jgi:hypothetical protein